MVSVADWPEPAVRAQIPIVDHDDRNIVPFSRIVKRRNHEAVGSEGEPFRQRAKSEQIRQKPDRQNEHHNQEKPDQPCPQPAMVMQKSTQPVPPDEFIKQPSIQILRHPRSSKRSEYRFIN